MPSKALADFAQSIGLAEALQRIEAPYPDPPHTPDDQRAVSGLRGGAIVLMLGAFERFVRECIAEHLAPFGTAPPLKHLSTLPDKLQVASVYRSLKVAMDGPRYGKPKGKAARLQDVNKAARRIVDGAVDPEAVGTTGGNADSATVKELLADLGILDPFAEMRPTFDLRWGKAEAVEFLVDKLNSIAGHRHRAAHSPTILTLSRDDMNEALRFIRTLAEALDDTVSRRVASF